VPILAQRQPFILVRSCGAAQQQHLMELSLFTAEHIDHVEAKPELSLPRLPRTSLLQIWRHLEYPDLTVLSHSCHSLHARIRHLPLERIGAPMVLSALLFGRQLDRPGAEAAVFRLRRCRVLCLALYVVTVLGFLPVLLFVRPPGTWRWRAQDSGAPCSDGWLLIALIYLALLVSCALATWAPFHVHCQGRLGLSDREALYLQLRSNDEYYTVSQWRMLRLIWLAYSGSSLLCPLLCIPNTVLIGIGLFAPLVAAAASVVAVRREFPPSPLRKSLSLQIVWLSGLILSVLCAAVARWPMVTDAVCHLGFVVSGSWCAATAFIAPKVVRELQAMSSSTLPPSHGVTGIGGGGGGCGGGGSPSAFTMRRRAQLSTVLLSSRLLVFWVTVLALFELFRMPAPTWLLAAPPLLGAVAAISLFLAYASLCGFHLLRDRAGLAAGWPRLHVGVV